MRAKELGTWLTAVPSQQNGTILSRDEFTDNLHYRFGFMPTNLPEYCDGCGDSFTAKHGLNSKKGGLVTARHDDVADEFKSLAMLAFNKRVWRYKMRFGRARALDRVFIS